MENKMQITNHFFLIYKTDNEEVKVSVMLINNDLWLSQNGIAELFDKDRKTITRYIQNIFKVEELVEKQVCSIFEYTASDK